MIFNVNNKYNELVGEDFIISEEVSKRVIDDDDRDSFLDDAGLFVDDADEDDPEMAKLAAKIPEYDEDLDDIDLESVVESFINETRKILK